MTTHAVFVIDNTKKPLGGQLKGAGAPPFQPDLKPRDDGHQGTQVAGGSLPVQG